MIFMKSSSQKWTVKRLFWKICSLQFITGDASNFQFFLNFGNFYSKLSHNKNLRAKVEEGELIKIDDNNGDLQTMSGQGQN